MADSNESQSPATGNRPSAISFQRLCEIVAKLRAPGGCPWDREQTHESLLPALIEEAYEVAGAVRANDTANFREELGDLLLLIVMHAEIASESGRFDTNGVLKNVTEKLIRRHPHVFGSSDARDSGAVLKQWESIKRAEKTHKHGRNAGDAGGYYLDDLPLALPAPMRVQNRQSKCEREENAGQPGCELHQNVRRLRAENVFCDRPAKCGTQAFALWTLHQDHEHHEQCHQNKKHRKQVDQKIHRGGKYR